MYSLLLQQRLLLHVSHDFMFWNEVMVSDVDKQESLLEIFQDELESHGIDDLWGREELISFANERRQPSIAENRRHLK